MAPDRYQALLEFVHKRAGDAFRVAASYGPDDWTILYVRDDIATPALRDALPTLAERFRSYEPVVTPDVYGDIGPAAASVELHEAAAIVHITEGERRGVVISLERDVAQGLGEFVRSCNEVLHGS